MTDVNNFYNGIGLFNSSVSNLPTKDWYMVEAAGVAGTDVQVATNLFKSYYKYQRNCASGTWSVWKKCGAIVNPNANDISMELGENGNYCIINSSSGFSKYLQIDQSASGHAVHGVGYDGKVFVIVEDNTKIYLT